MLAFLRCSTGFDASVLGLLFFGECGGWYTLLTHLPKDLAVPVRLQRHAAFPWRLALKRFFGNLSVIKESALLREVAVQARGIRHFPGVGDVAMKVDQVDCSVAFQRHKQRQACRSPSSI